jgi:ribonuclease HII
MLSVRYESDDKVEAGVDEAGRGCFWGDMYAGAVIWPSEADWTPEIRTLSEQIRDSKKISPKKRERICDGIMEHAVAFGIGTVSAAEIDDNGMTWANQTAFARAIDALKVRPDRILVDGILALPYGYLKEDQESHTIIEGDAQYLCIAAASILAKVSHDRWLQGRVDAEPDLETKYNLRSCKGYGTAKHRAGIEAHGLHPMHRRRFLTKKKEGCLIRLPGATAATTTATTITS